MSRLRQNGTELTIKDAADSGAVLEPDRSEVCNLGTGGKLYLENTQSKSTHAENSFYVAASAH